MSVPRAAEWEPVTAPTVTLPAVTLPTVTLRLTLSGPDRPGLTSALFTALHGLEVEVIDLEQVIVGGHLTLGILLGAATPGAATLGAATPGAATPGAASSGAPADRLRAAHARVADTCRDLGLACEGALSSETPALPRRSTDTLIVTVLARPLRPTAVTAVANRLASAGGNIERITRLGGDPVTAVEFIVTGAELGVARSLLCGSSHLPEVTIAVRQRGLDERGRRLVVLDVDSTLIEQEVINLLARFAGAEAEVARITEEAMAGRLDFAQSLSHRVRLLAGLPERVLADVTAQIQLTPGADVLVRTLLQLGDRVALVSGGFHQVIDPLARDLGVTEVHANTLEVCDGHLTGRTTGTLVDRGGKARVLREVASRCGIPLRRTVAVGDGANDLDMLEAAGLGIAFNAAPAVAARADAAIHLRRLDSVLFLLGIRSEEVAELA